MDVSATVVDGRYAVRLTATGNTGAVTWWRVGRGQPDQVGTGADVVDRSAPLNVTLQYYATDDVTIAQCDPLSVFSDMPLLASTMSSTCYPVRIESWRPYSGQGRSMWHPVIGRNDPLVTVFPSVYPSGTLTIVCPGYGMRNELVRMLQPGDPLLLRSHDPELIDTMTFVIVSWQDPYVEATQRDAGPILLQIDYQRITEAGVAWQPAPGRTYADVRGEAATYADLPRMYRSYTALRDGTR